jgi:GNAT superfamily N-acetyltransferase
MYEYRVRTATPDDLSTILYHRKRMFEDMGFKGISSLDAALETSRALIQRGLESGRYRGWLIMTPGGEIVAGGGIFIQEFPSHPRDPRPERAWVVNMFTEPVHRRRGLGRMLMNAILEWCRGAGMKSVYLHASDAGRPLYENLGFTPTNEMRITLSEVPDHQQGSRP